MNLSNELLFFFSTLGWFNGFLLGIYFLVVYKSNTLSRIMFGLMLLALGVRVAKSVLWWFIPDLPLIVIQLGLVACFFIGPLLYYYVRASVAGLKEMPVQWKVTLAFYIFISLVLLLFFSGREYLIYWRNYIIPAIYFQWFIYIIFSGFQIKEKIKSVFDKTTRLKPNDKWLLAVYTGSFMISLGYGLSFLGVPHIAYITGPVSFSLILYLNTLILFYRKKTTDLFQSEPEKYANKKIDPQAASLQIQQLEQLMSESQLYTNPDLKLNDLAATLNISPHQLSQLLNDNLGKTFNAYINAYRIKKACEIISTDSNLKLEAIGYEVGFNSKSSFFTAFKKITGTTPKLFKEQSERR
jgi:AraC-like DNA-binding protein